jgi:hypothetical protein
VKPATAAWLATMRAWAADPGAVIFPIRTTTANVALFPEDITTRTDEQLLAFIAARCRPQPI